MSSAYDPRSSRPRPASAPDPEAAPIDALLGPEPASEPVEVADADRAANGAATPPASPAARASGPVSNAGAPSRLVQLLPLLVLGSLVALVVWWFTRGRRSA